MNRVILHNPSPLILLIPRVDPFPILCTKPRLWLDNNHFLEMVGAHPGGKEAGDANKAIM